MAGVSRQQHTTEVKLIRVACTGRVDLTFIHRAFARGADGVFIGGCWPNECHYVTSGNFDALANVQLYRKLLQRIGIQPERLRLEWIAASEGTRYAELMNDFVGELRALGPTGEHQAELQAVERLLPYLKLVERERLRAPRSEEACRRFYASEETNRLFDELISDQLAASRIVSLLRERPMSTGEIAERLGLSPPEVSRHMNRSSRQGLVGYEENRWTHRARSIS